MKAFVVLKMQAKENKCRRIGKALQEKMEEKERLNEKIEEMIGDEVEVGLDRPGSSRRFSGTRRKSPSWRYRTI
jgi:hypothetical protein